MSNQCKRREFFLHLFVQQIFNILLKRQFFILIISSDLGERNAHLNFLIEEVYNKI